MRGVLKCRVKNTIYVDSCIGKYSILPSAILQTEVDEVTKKLEPYSVIISTAGFY